eukprot:IDg14590t1
MMINLTYKNVRHFWAVQLSIVIECTHLSYFLNVHDNAWRVFNSPVWALPLYLKLLSERHQMERISRIESAYNQRLKIARLARDRPHEKSYSNGEEGLYRDPRTGRPSYTARFTKGMPHRSNGQLANPKDYILFIRAIDSGIEFDIRRSTVRAWESMAGGLAYSLQGPDAHDLALPPAPTLDSPQLAVEMGELYMMALLRDTPFSAWGTPANTHPDISMAISRLNELLSISKTYCRGRGLYQTRVSLSTIFRGMIPGVDRGPYISQFLLIGTINLGDKGMESTLDGKVRFGAASISQKVQIATPDKDYMTDFSSFLDVQDGADLRGLESYETGQRFITTPRDLATYVHYD